MQPQAEAEAVKTHDAASTSGQVSAMALDLMLDSEAVVEKHLKNPNEPDEVDDSVEAEDDLTDDVLISGEDAQHWFSLLDLEAQVKTVRNQDRRHFIKELPVQQLQVAQLEFARSFGVEEVSADADDDEDGATEACYVRRVRPGEHLAESFEDQFDPEGSDVELTDEDLAVFTAENAFDSGFFGFLAEAADFDEFGEEEEV
jgi:hypothetical protein